MKRFYGVFTFLLGIGIIYSLYKISETKNIVSLLLAFDFFSFVYVIIATLAISFCATARWMLLLKCFPHTKFLPFSKYLQFFLWGRVGSFFMPKEFADIGVRSLLLARTKTVKGKVAMISAFVDRLFDVAVILALALPSAFYFLNQISLGTTLQIIFFTTLIILFLPFFFVSHIRRMLAYVLWLWKAKKEKIPLEDIVKNVSFLSPAFVFLIIGLSLSRFFFVILRFYIIAHAYAMPVPISTFFVLTPVAVLGYLVSITPGGLGFVEAGWYGVLSFFPLMEEIKITFVIGQRIIIFLGLFACFILTAIWRKYHE